MLKNLWIDNHNIILIFVFVCGVLGAIKLFRLLGSSPPRKPYRQIGRINSESVVVEGSSGIPLRDTPAGKLGASIQNGVCPDCGSKEGFFKGPEGGMSINLFCSNPKCRSGFNYTNMFHEGHAERIQNGINRLYE